MNKVIFIGAGPGNPELITVKGKNILEKAKIILYTGSLVPKEILKWAPENCIIKSSEDMSYCEIFDFFEKYITQSDIVRLHTGDPSLYSTIAKQIKYLKEKGILYEVIPGVTAAFGAAASSGIEYTIPGISQTLILTRIEGKTPNPENLEKILECKFSAKVFYLSVNMLNDLITKALESGYSIDTPCWVIEKATWPEEKVIKGTFKNITELVKEHNIKRTALILVGDFLNQEETEESHLYSETFNR